MFLNVVFLASVITPSSIRPFLKYAEDGSLNPDGTRRVVHRRHKITASGKCYVGSTALAALRAGNYTFPFEERVDFMELALVDLMAFLPPEEVVIEDVQKIDLFELMPKLKAGDRIIVHGQLYQDTYNGVGKSGQAYSRQSIILRPLTIELAPAPKSASKKEAA